MFYLPHTPLILPQLIYFPFLILLFTFNFHPRPHLPYIDPTLTLSPPFFSTITFLLFSTTTTTFLLLSLHHHHRHNSIVFPPTPPPPHFYCFPSTSTTTITFLLFSLHLQDQGPFSFQRMGCLFYDQFSPTSF